MAERLQPVTALPYSPGGQPPPLPRKNGTPQQEKATTAARRPPGAGHRCCATARGRSPLLRDRQGHVTSLQTGAPDPAGLSFRLPSRAIVCFAPGAIVRFAMRAWGVPPKRRLGPSYALPCEPGGSHRSGAWGHRRLCHASLGGPNEAAPGAIAGFAMRAGGVLLKRRLGPSRALQ